MNALKSNNLISFNTMLHFLTNGFKRPIYNIILSLLFGLIIGLLIFNMTEHERVYKSKEVLDLPGTTKNEDLLESSTDYEVFVYNYKPAIYGFVISSGIFFLYYNRSRK